MPGLDLPLNDYLRPGFRLGRYAIVRRLSAGGYGAVYLARRQDGKLVALKEFLPRLMACRRPEDKGLVRPQTPSAAKSFQHGLRVFFREAEILAKIHDDRVIAVWDVFEANGTAYFAMPVERGLTLQAAIAFAPQPLTDRVVRNLLIDACRGVEALHRHGLLHLDLKPHNLWLRPDGTVVVLDLGASRWAGEEGGGASLVRTPGYAAPEQHGAVQVGALNERTDVYGLAATFRTAVESARPPAAPQRRLKALDFFKRRLGQRDRGLLAVLDRGMALRPEDRWQTVADMRHALERSPVPTDMDVVRADGLGASRAIRPLSVGVDVAGVV